MNDYTPDTLFLFSLPRSGSTFVQRILSSHKEIATVSEPWILLPYLYTLKKKGVYSEYNHETTINAIKDFYMEFPNGRDDYLLEIRNFTLKLYAKAIGNSAKYFLDKTPRYSLVVNEIINLFPEGKFIFLWRNPLAVVTSIIETWGKKKLKLYPHKVDLFSGLENMVEAYKKQRNRIHTVRYEDLVLNPQHEFRKIFDYLDLQFSDDLLTKFSDINLKGRMYDHAGVENYSSISREPLEKWKRTLANPVRKIWCRRYLHWIGKERLSLMGYDLDELTNELNEIPSSMRYVASDIVRIAASQIYYWAEPKIFRDKLAMLSNRSNVHIHR